MRTRAFSSKPAWPWWAALWTLSLLVLCSPGGVGMDPSEKTAWSENVGWVNVAPTHGGVTLYYDGTGGHLSGFAWAENVGWIKLGHSSGGPYGNTSATDWGVNMAGNGDLSGYAWSENAGWIKLDPTYSQVTIDKATGRFSAYAWGENIGWIRFAGLSPQYSVRTLAFDTQPHGTPNWWLDYHGVGETTDTDGDGLLAWEEYVAVTDPTSAASLLEIVAVSNRPVPGVTVLPVPHVYYDSATNRLYRLLYATNVVTGPWEQVPGQHGIPGDGNRNSMVDINAMEQEQRFYRIGVELW